MVAHKICTLQFIIFLASGIYCEDCGVHFECVKFSECQAENEDFVYPCYNGDEGKVCCPIKDKQNRIVTRAAAFPVNCGLFEEDNKITGGEIAGIGQFPWMALLGYNARGIDFLQFLCGATLITQTYVLTAAHCTNLPGLYMTTVRLGELDLSTEKDCEVLEETQTCSSPHLDVPVAKVIPHKKFNSSNLKNDVALVQMARKVTFTDFIRPICLPFDMKLKSSMFYGQKFYVSGWGKTTSDNLGGSNKLLFAKVSVWNINRCNKLLPNEVKPISDDQICANGAKSEDACKGDSGGPLFNSTVLGNDVRGIQYGIVSFSGAQICGSDFPTVYTRIDYFLEWIVKNAK